MPTDLQHKLGAIAKRLTVALQDGTVWSFAAGDVDKHGLVQATSLLRPERGSRLPTRKLRVYLTDTNGCGWAAEYA
jgi:hypothetical protein